NPDWKTTWGLGFVVYKGANGNTWAGHGGSCPGYRSTLQLDLKRKRAYSVMINASGTNPNKYSSGIDAILSKVRATKTSKEGEAKANKLKEYVGYYNPMPWWSEEYISTWGDQLVVLGLPAEKPGNALTFLKHIEGDTFRRIRADKELGETIVFQRDRSGKVISYSQHGNYSQKIER
ncbi:MAG: hypothetical protein KTR30_23995, partial [Saprospiraceae bacterium]|nr:hypothetical protein [Saprospiraceae bacterium]